MSESFATSADVALRWRPLTPSEDAVAGVLVDDASDMIRSRWSDVDARIASGALSQASVVRVVAGMVKRAMIAADAAGIEQRSQGAGPFSVSEKYANPSGNLYFTAEDLRLFEPEEYAKRAHVGWLA